MENSLEHVAGKSVAAEVMEGSEQITEKTDKRKIVVRNGIPRIVQHGRNLDLQGITSFLNLHNQMVRGSKN